VERMREFGFTFFTFFSNLLGETFPETVTICLCKSQEISSTPACSLQILQLLIIISQTFVFF
jgi:hypothetical protein